MHQKPPKGGVVLKLKERSRQVYQRLNRTVQDQFIELAQKTIGRFQDRLPDQGIGGSIDSAGNQFTAAGIIE